jgi:hypothetical protein
MLAALVSSIPPFSTRRSSSRPPSAAQETAAAPAISARPVNALVSTPASKPVTERTMRIGAIRVAIKSLILDAKSFSVERLKKGQRVPDGMTEAMLVVTRAIGGSIDWETNLRLTEGSATRTSSPPANPAPVRYVSKPSRPPEKPTAEGAMCAATIRVSIAGSIGDATSFTVERFDAGGPLPAGTMEGMLVLTGGIEGSIQIETHVPVPTA